ncbi:MAG: cation:proton antiporter [Salinibacter sp.]|uniref:cation:proton antiporter n=1 Tax=Salinibacter sp. TaxID=2065818 RepID=UPI002FC2860A
MEHALLVNTLLVGAVVVCAIAMRYGAEQNGLSPIVGYFVLGILLRTAASFEVVPLLTEQQVFPFLADLGVIALLFRVGLESDLGRLLDQLPEASWIGLGNVLGSGGIAFATAFLLIDWPLVPSLFVATALTATSVGVSVALWEEADQLESREGSTLVDVAEFDDLMGVLLMALLFAAAPLLREAGPEALLSILAPVVGWMLLKLVLFGGACLLFAWYVERPMTHLFERLHAGEGTMLVMLGVGIIVAAIAGLLGFSVAIGAFFAGLIFSRDPHTTQYMDAFRPLHDLFALFFFVGIGLHLAPEAVGAIGGGVVLLLAAAVLGKVVGAYVPALPVLGSSGALVLGLSLVPRAEVALVILQRGLELGAWAVPPTIFAQVVLVSAVTVLVMPFVLRPLLTPPSVLSTPESS